jgi:hypothetical protein
MKFQACLMNSRVGVSCESTNVLILLLSDSRYADLNTCARAENQTFGIHLRFLPTKRKAFKTSATFPKFSKAQSAY